MRVINPKFIEDGIKAFKLVYYAIFLLAVWYSLCHFITDTLGINFLDGASSLEMGSVVIIMLLIIVYLFLLFKLSIKSLYEYVYIDIDKIAIEYINKIVVRMKSNLSLYYTDGEDNDECIESDKYNSYKWILETYKKIIDQELCDIYKCKKYSHIVIKNIDVYVKISNVDKEPIILGYGQSLEEYIKNNKE